MKKYAFKKTGYTKATNINETIKEAIVEAIFNPINNNLENIV